MNKSLVLDFRFKGERTYVHGTDIYTQLTDYLSKNGATDLKSLDITFHQITRTNLEGGWVEGAEALSGLKPAVAFRFKNAGVDQAIWLKENGKPVTGRYPYDEESIRKLCTIDVAAQTMTLAAPATYSNIETIVAMNKALLQSLFPSAPGKWYFTRLQVETDINQCKWGTIKLAFKGHFNFKITKTLVQADGRDIGFIYFSLIS